MCVIQETVRLLFPVLEPLCHIWPALSKKPPPLFGPKKPPPSMGRRDHPNASIGDVVVIPQRGAFSSGRQELVEAWSGRKRANAVPTLRASGRIGGRCVPRHRLVMPYNLGGKSAGWLQSGGKICGLQQMRMIPVGVAICSANFTSHTASLRLSTPIKGDSPLYLFMRLVTYYDMGCCGAFFEKRGLSPFTRGVLLDEGDSVAFDFVVYGFLADVEYFRRLFLGAVYGGERLHYGETFYLTQ